MKTKAEKLCKLNLHCYKLARVLSGLDSMTEGYPSSRELGDESFGGAASWLQLAADLKSITLDPLSDGSAMFCESANDYENAKARLDADFALWITRFTFSWTAFEILVAALGLEPHPSQRRKRDPSKGRMGTWFLKKNAADANEYRGYLHVLEHAFECMSRNEALQDVKVPHPKDADYINEAGFGLDICRELRNKNLHGLMQVPIPSDWGEDRDPDRKDIYLYSFALRLLLISIQMMLVCQLNPKLRLGEDDLLFEDSGPDLFKYLKTLHLEETKAHNPSWVSSLP